MELHQFRSDAPSQYISAERLDANFRRVSPLRNTGSGQQYWLTETPDGWSLRIFPIFPADGGTYVLAVRGGTLAWLPTSECT